MSDEQLHPDFKKLEPVLSVHDAHRVLLRASEKDIEMSKAISLKRIADALDRIGGDSGELHAFVRSP